MFNVVVEGNIGSGKTTLINFLSTKYGNRVKCFFEPVDKWRSFRGINLFSIMYQNPQRWAFAFQQYVQLTMMKLHEEIRIKQNAGYSCLMERSLFSARYCFVENLYKNKLIEDVEYFILDEWFNYLIKSQNLIPDLIVYLRVDPEICYRRVMTRSRPEESNISLNFIKDMHQVHEDWLNNSKNRNMTTKPFSIPVLIIDNGFSEEHCQKTVDRYASVILGDEKMPEI